MATCAEAPEKKSRDKKGSQQHLGKRQLKESLSERDSVIANQPHRQVAKPMRDASDNKVLQLEGSVVCKMTHVKQPL